MIRPEMTFGQRLKEFREDRKLSKLKLAELAQINVGTLHNYEADRNAPMLPVVVRICDALEVDIEYLIPDEWRIKKGDTNNEII